MIKQFNFDIYPCCLFVAINVSTKELLNNFLLCDKYDLHDTIKVDIDELEEKLFVCDAVTTPVISKRNGSKGILILLKSNTTIRTMVHESVHATDYVFEMTNSYSQEFSEGNEPYAYLVDWIFSKVYNTVKRYKRWKTKKGKNTMKEK